MAGKGRNLPPGARAAARLEVAGATSGEIAAKLGVGDRTVRSWRKRADYRELRDRLATETDRAVLEVAVEVRTEALETVRGLVRRIRRRTEGGDDERAMGDTSAAMSLQAVLAAYKTVAAQTGISETSKQQVEVAIRPEDEAEAARRLLEGMRGS